MSRREKKFLIWATALVIFAFLCAALCLVMRMDAANTIREAEEAGEHAFSMGGGVVFAVSVITFCVVGCGFGIASIIVSSVVLKTKKIALIWLIAGVVSIIMTIVFSFFYNLL